MKCDEFRGRYLAGEHDPTLENHLRTCGPCRSDRDGLDELRTALGQPSLWEEPHPDLQERVMALIGAHVEPSPRRPWWVLAAAVAAVIVAVGIGTWNAQEPPAPDWQLTLVGTGAAPGAVGVVQGWEAPSGTAIFIRIDGLGRAPEGHYYELWFVGEKGRVSAGTFWEATGFELWAAASLEDYPEIGVTVEPDDGDPGPSGTKVMGSQAGP